MQALWLAKVSLSLELSEGVVKSIHQSVEFGLKVPVPACVSSMSCQLGHCGQSCAN